MLLEVFLHTQQNLAFNILLCSCYHLVKPITTTTKKFVMKDQGCGLFINPI